MLFFCFLKSGMTTDAGSYCLLGDTDTHIRTCLYNLVDTQTHTESSSICVPIAMSIPLHWERPGFLLLHVVSMDWHFLDDKDGSDFNRALLNHKMLPPASLGHTTDPPGAHWCPKPRLWVFTPGDGPDVPSLLNWSTGCYFGTLTASSLRLIIWTSDYCSHVILFFIFQIYNGK